MRLINTRSTSSRRPLWLLLILIPLLQFLSSNSIVVVDASPDDNVIISNNSNSNSNSNSKTTTTTTTTAPIYNLGGDNGGDNDSNDSNDLDSFISGCLYKKNSTKYPKSNIRVCNSEDTIDTINKGLCRQTTIQSQDQLLEIRLFAQDWESSIFLVWIIQIILSELLDIPTTVETGRLDIPRNYYLPERIEFDRYRKNKEIKYSFNVGLNPSLLNAAKYGDCTSASKVAHKYEPCAHFSPEVWPSWTHTGSVKGNDFDRFISEQIIEPLEPLTAIGQQSLFIPKFTAIQDPSLLNYYGYSGESNRKKLADTFLRPTTWKDYCDFISLNNCTQPDNYSQRAPLDSSSSNTIIDDDQEESRYFVEGLYTGYFRKTNKNDCINNPTNCTGHVADLPCGMFSPLLTQIHQLDIALDGDGDEPHIHSYTRSQLHDIWRAANATKSNVAMYWWSPETLYQDFVGTDAEFTKVSFPLPNQECMAYRHLIKRCSAVPHLHEGDPRAICEEPPLQLNKIQSKSIFNLTIDGIPKAIQSPAYDTLKLFTMSELQIADLLDYFKQTDNKSPRTAVCDWVYDNMDFIQQTVVPESYPRVFEEETNTGLTVTALIISGISVLLVLWTGRTVYILRNERAIQHSQIEFLYLVLGGTLLIALGAILVASPPSNPSCVTSIWLIHLGYTLSLVPQIVKVAAINRLLMAAKRYRRMYLKLQNLYGAVALITGIMVIYLIVWSVLDPPRKVAGYVLTGDVTPDNDETIINVGYSCSSSTDIWEYVAVSWNGLLLFCAVVLAVQTRTQKLYAMKGIMADDSRVLGNLIYANFAFLNFRIVTFFVVPIVEAWVLSRIRSIIYGLDAIATIFIYFWPKFLQSWKASENDNNSRSSTDMFDLSVRFTTPKRRGSLMMQTPPTNRFIRFLTEISNITQHGSNDSSEHALDGVKSFADDVESSANDSKGGAAPVPSQMSDWDSSTDDDDNAPSTTKGDTVGTQSESFHSPLEEKVSQQEETIKTLKEEIQCLRLRLNRKKNGTSCNTY